MALVRGHQYGHVDFDRIEDYLLALRRGTKQYAFVEDMAVKLMAHVAKGFAQGLYMGPQANPQDVRRGSGAGAAWTIPVRRITGRTREGWQVRRLGLGVHEVVNYERGAFAVEYGLSRGGNGVRRPIMKMAVGETMMFVQRTRLGPRIVHGTFGSLKNNRGDFRSAGATMLGMSGVG